MARECDRPKREESAGKGTPKGDKGKSDKGKSKGKPGDAGKGKRQAKQLGEAIETSATEGRELRQQSSNPKEPEIGHQTQLEEFEKLVIKAMKEKVKPTTHHQQLKSLTYSSTRCRKSLMEARRRKDQKSSQR